MKYLYSIIFFLIFVFGITYLINFNYTQEVENFDMEDQNITTIDVNALGANVSIATTVDKDIKIEHAYSKAENPSSSLYTYVENNTLYVNEYPHIPKNIISKKESVNIYIPEEYSIEKLDVETDSGKINMDSIETGELNVKSVSGNVDLANVKVDDLSVIGGTFGTNLSNIVAKNLDSKMDSNELTLKNSIIDNVNIANGAKSAVLIEKLVTNDVSVTGLETDVKLNLNEENDYIFNTGLMLPNSRLEATDKGYQYVKNELKQKTTYNLNDLESVELTFTNINVNDTVESEVEDE